MATVLVDETTEKPPTVKRGRKSNDGRSSEIEDFLRERAITFEFLTGVRPVRFDLERSLRNQARVGQPVNKDTAQRYVEAIKNGDTFPPVLAYEDGGKLLILDGNHRLVAHTETGESMNAYVLKGDPQSLAWVSFEANTRHGLPSSEEDRVNHAIWLIENGVSFAEARQRLGVPQGPLRKALSAHQADRRADEVGILRRDWESIMRASRARLSNITTDEGFRAAVRLTKDAGLQADEVFELVTKLNESRSGTRQEAMVEALRHAYEDRIAEVRVAGASRTGKKRAVGPRQRLSMTLGQLTALPDPTAFSHLPDIERRELADRVQGSIEQLEKIQAALRLDGEQ